MSDLGTSDAGQVGVDLGDETDAGGTDSGAEDAGLPDAGPPGPSATIGLGQAELIEVPDEAPAELIAGPQGGFHIDVALRFSELDPEDLRMVLRGFDADTNEEITESVDRTLSSRRVLDRGDHFLRLGDRMIFVTRCTPNIIGRRLRIEAIFAEPNEGRTARDTLVVEVVDEVEPTEPDPDNCPPSE